MRVSLLNLEIALNISSFIAPPADKCQTAESTTVREGVVPTPKAAPKRLAPIKIEKEALRPKSAHFGRNLSFARRRGARRKVVPEKRKMRPSSSGGFRQAFAGIPSPHQRVRTRVDHEPGGERELHRQQHASTEVEHERSVCAIPKLLLVNPNQLTCQYHDAIAGNNTIISLFRLRAMLRGKGCPDQQPRQRDVSRI